MGKYIIIVICFLLGSYCTVASQEVIITDFPLGIGGSIDSNFFKPYYSQLELLADTLAKYPMAMAVVTGGADGIQFSENHDSQNPGLAMGRANILRNLLINRFNVDSNKILIQSSNVKANGSSYRYAGVRIDWKIANLDARLDNVEKRQPAEKHLSENMGLQLGAGFSSSPFGALPIITGAITWKRFVFIEGIVGHTFWDNSFRFEGTNLSTRRRMIGGLASIYPSSKIPVGLVGGWIRVEEISQRYNEYVKMSEGPVIGLRVTPVDFFSITAVQNTSKHNIMGDIKSRLKNKQFLLFATVHIIFGGGK